MCAPWEPRNPKKTFADMENNTFEAHGQTWFKHKPGDPMPCDENQKVITVFREELEPNHDFLLVRDSAGYWDWNDDTETAILGWNYA